ncbi:MAG TPA: hypothetical protein VNW92_05025 [Polyangiaceae bacterium]|jgi:hypothetical protein|nr:hypothetical protein [Polyangiaceae bacterium]
MRIRALHSLALGSIILLGVTFQRLACAQSRDASPSRASALASNEAAPGKASLWRDDWPEFRTSEAILTAIAAVGTGVIVLIGPSEHPRWTGGILFDDAVRSELRARDPSTRSRFRTIGNYSYHLACGLAASNALLTATTRVVADRHYATDVLTGLGIGFGIGYAVPVLLHYSYGGANSSIAIGPDPSCGGNCISVLGNF